MNKVSFAILGLLFLFTTASAASEKVHIVTSQDNHCTWEFTADETCLTLQQYVYDPSLNSNATLIMESGRHVLQGQGMMFEFNEIQDTHTDSNGYSLVMMAESATVVYSSVSSSLFAFSIEYQYSPILTVRNARYVHISGVSFVSNNDGYVKLENVQKVFIEFCKFQGVKLHFYKVDDATISKSSFFNYSHANDLYNFDHEFGALFISQSSVLIMQSNFTNNHHSITYHDHGHDTDGTTILPSQSYELEISESAFTNNTSVYKGSALYVSGSPSVTIHQSVFIFNTAGGSGGALHLDRQSDSAVYSIRGSTFIFNDASFCGAFSIDNYHGVVVINDSNFYYNSAVDSKDGVGGVGCIRNSSVTINNCSFIANRAKGDAGGLHLEESRLTIKNSNFSNNTAGRDGGAVHTYAHPSDYLIAGSIFNFNVAGDDGGAVFVGRKGSNITLDKSTFTNNSAADRGGAISIIATMLNVSQTSIYGNLADKGKQISACNSFVPTFISGRNDPNFPSCALYDPDSAGRSYRPSITFHYWDINWLNSTVDEIVLKYVVFGNKTFTNKTSWSGFSNQTDSNGVYHLLRQTSIIAYAALAVSVSTAVSLLFCIIVLKLLVYCRRRRQKKGQFYLLTPQAEDDDDEALLADHRK